MARTVIDMLVLSFSQVLSPLAKGLFHKAISESGTVTLGLFTDQPKEDAQVGITGNFNYFSQVVHRCILSCSVQNIETWFLSCESKQSLKTVFLCASSTCLRMCCYSNSQISTKRQERNVNEKSNM